MTSSGYIQSNTQTLTSQAGISFKIILNPTQILIVCFNCHFKCWNKAE